TKTKFQQRPRIAMAPSGDFFMAMDGLSFDTNFNAVLIQQIDPEGNFVGDFFNPHSSDPGPNSNHQFSDFATNGSSHVVVWQDARQDANWDITAQFYNNSGATGGNIKVNNGDAAGTINIWPSIAMNQSGNSVTVWADARTGADGEIFGQLFNANGQAVGGNFQISAGQGKIMDRPETTILDDGSFMVVWTDSTQGVSGIAAFRARGRQFSANATPLSDVFILPNQDFASLTTNIATDGSSYYLTWLDDRRHETYLNLFMKKMGSLATSVATLDPILPPRFELFNAYPNPFNPSTTIQFAVPFQSKVTITLFDLLGREVTTLIDEEYKPGEYKLVFEAEGLASGIYFYRISSTTTAGPVKDFVQTKKLTLLK
ncbi:MAG: T9SS type A sorting domain-containing protein, partial [Calditrichaeota bacterium]|nr:T9SS type A sorting domain-containing protein [Calditrichota bacterium]